MSDRRKSGDDLTGRRQGYGELKKELHGFFKKIWFVVLVIGVTSIVGLVGYGFAIREVQRQRLEYCEDQNSRNDNTKAALNKEAAKDIESRETEAGKIEVRRRRDVTLGLIDLLQPKLKCSEVVETGIEAYLP